MAKTLAPPRDGMVVRQRDAGDSCLGAQLIRHGYEEMPEFRAGGTLAQVTARILSSTTNIDRYELLVFSEGKVVGFACAAEDDDLNVGLCLSLQWQYVLPEHRGTAGREFLRWLLRTGKVLGYRHVAYSHRINQGHYAIKYRRVKNG